MIHIVDKQNCCGCEACVQACPKHCIDFITDQEGFMYPSVREERCVNCGLCEKVCPVLNRGHKRSPELCYAAVNPDESERLKSSSGGIFILLAKQVIKDGGVVFGARFDDKWNVVHGFAQTIDDVYPFMGSKYVQSRIGTSFIEVRKFLEQGRQVLFTGTPCQVAGLKMFLRKDYKNLITVDLICHGVPSPKVWSQYLTELKVSALQGANSVSLSSNRSISGRDAFDKAKQMEFKGISFRDKALGWKKFCFAFTLAESLDDGKQNTVSLSYTHDKDLYFLGFNNYNLFLRPSCMVCPAKDLRSGSDITLADFWGIDTLYPNINDDKGISAVMVNSEKGKDMMSTLNASLQTVEFADIAVRNRSVSISSTPPPISYRDFIKYKKVFKNKRECFFYDAERSVSERVRILARPNFRQQIRGILRYIYHTFIH